MPRRINKKCLACSQLSADAAQQLHGPEGDNCWNPKICPRRRSHYRHRRDNNSKRRAYYREQVGDPGGEAPAEVEVQATLPPVAYLYLYREKRQNAPLHAISASVWQGEVKLADVKPIHCSGLRNRQIQEYLARVLENLRDRYGISKFEPEIRLEPSECPLADCALKQAPVDGIEISYD